MTPDERNLLTRFLQDLDQARTGPKDAEAEAMINQALSRNPDAAYLLVQHTIVSDQALQAAQARIKELESGAPASGSFLGGGARPQPQTAVPASQPYGYDQPPPPPPSSPFSMGGGLGSFLRNAGTTAAGVAGGEMLFAGLSGLFGGHGGGFGGGFGSPWGGGGGGFGQPVENVTINEYNDDNGGNYDDGNYGDDGGGWNDNG